MIQRLPDHLINKIILYNRHPIAEIFNSNLFIDHQMTGKLAITIISKYADEYVFILDEEDAAAQEQHIFSNGFIKKLKIDYIHNIKSRIYKPYSKAEQNYEIRFF
jgi:hypothetical protein